MAGPQECTQPSLAVPPSSFEAISSCGVSRGGSLFRAKHRAKPKRHRDAVLRPALRSWPLSAGDTAHLHETVASGSSGSQDEYPLPAEQGDLAETCGRPGLPH